MPLLCVVVMMLPLMIESYLGGHDVFVRKMNLKAKEIGMNNTTFENSSGLDEDGEENYSTVLDMAKLMAYASNNPKLLEIMNTKVKRVKTNKNFYQWHNKNKLLYLYKYTLGGKTGYTKKAKRTLVTYASKNDVNLIVVTFNDRTDFNTHKNLYEYGFKNYKNYLVLNKKNIKLNKNEYIKNNYYYLLKDNEYEYIKLKRYNYRKKYKNTSGLY